MDREESCNNFEELFENRKVNNEGGGEKEEKTCQIECLLHWTSKECIVALVHSSERHVNDVVYTSIYGN